MTDPTLRARRTDARFELPLDDVRRRHLDAGRPVHPDRPAVAGPADDPRPAHAGPGDRGDGHSARHLHPDRRRAGRPLLAQAGADADQVRQRRSCSACSPRWCSPTRSRCRWCTRWRSASAWHPPSAFRPARRCCRTWWRPHHLQLANGMMMGMRVLTALAGPLLAGLLIAFSGHDASAPARRSPTCAAWASPSRFDALSFAVTTWTLHRVQLHAGAVRAAPQRGAARRRQRPGDGLARRRNAQRLHLLGHDFLRRRRHHASGHAGAGQHAARRRRRARPDHGRAWRRQPGRHGPVCAQGQPAHRHARHHPARRPMRSPACC